MDFQNVKRVFCSSWEISYFEWQKNSIYTSLNELSV